MHSQILLKFGKPVHYKFSEAPES